MKSTIIFRLLVIICICNCACWTTALAIELPSHQKQQIIELLLEEEQQFFKLPSQSSSPLPASSPTLPTTSSPPPPPALSPPPPEVNYPTVIYNFGGFIRSYKYFINRTRHYLKGPNDLAKFGIPMLRDPDTITNFDRFLLVILSDGLKSSVTLALRVSDGNLVGYCCSYDPTTHNTAWFFDDTTEDEKTLLFQDENVKHQYLGFKGNYDSLGSRNEFPLDGDTLTLSITALSRPRSVEDLYEIKNALLIITQMVSEAARFQYIAGPVASTMDDGKSPSLPDALAHSYENNWETLSKEVANGFGLGILRNPVALKDENGLVLKTVQNVSQIRDEVSMLAFVKT